MESACNVLGDEVPEEVAEFEGEIMDSKAVLLFDLEGVGEYDCVMNLGCECDRRSELDEK